MQPLPYPDDELQTATPATCKSHPSVQESNIAPSNPFYISNAESKAEEPAQSTTIGQQPIRRISHNKIAGSPDNALCFKKLAKTKSGNPILYKLAGSFIKDDTKSETKFDHNEQQSILSFISGTPKSGCTVISKDRKLNKTTDTTFSVLSKLSDNTICEKKGTKKDETRSLLSEYRSNRKIKTVGPVIDSIIPMSKCNNANEIRYHKMIKEKCIQNGCCCRTNDKNSLHCVACCSII